MRILLLALVFFGISHATASDISTEISSFFEKKSDKKSKKFLIHFEKEGDSGYEDPCEVYDIPLVYDSIWPFFCYKHLAHDPSGCSSWTHNADSKLEFLQRGNALAHTDKALIERIGEGWKFLPKIDSEEEGEGSCDYGQCSICKNTIIRSYFLNDDFQMDIDLEVNGNSLLLYRCNCLKPGSWYTDLILDYEHHEHSKFCLSFKKSCPHWKFCLNQTIFPGYFNWSYQTYFHFLQRFLNYLNSNKHCTCYWPHENSSISNGVFLTLDWLARFTKLREAMATHAFSPYLNLDVTEEFARGLIMHAFFYSDYHRIFSDLDQFSYRHLGSSDYQKVHQALIEATDKILPYFQRKYSRCLLV